MSKIGEQLDSFDVDFDEWFEDDLLVTNYEVRDSPTGPDEWDDPNEKQPTVESPIQVRGQVDPIGAVSDSEPWARDIDADVVIFVDDDTTISDGERPNMPYPSDVDIVGRFRRYRVVQITNEGNGLFRCLATSVPYRGEQA